MTSISTPRKMSGYDTLPEGATIQSTKFNVSVPEQDLKDFQELLRLSKLGPHTYENSQTNQRFGVSYEWMANTKSYWETEFDWRKHEAYINSFPNYTATIKDDDDSSHTIHFVALFSEKKDAIPVMCSHGWPGSFLEFLSLLTVFKTKYSPQELPYHLIIPSLPGYAFSSTPPLDRDWTIADSARLLHKLMVGLGFGGGYAVQGGDIGSHISRVIGGKYDACKAIHLNFCVMTKPPPESGITLSAAEQDAIARCDEFARTAAAYALEQGTRPSTIGFVLSSSPLALLAWIGEKFLTWTDENPPLEHILESVTLYWLTESFARCIYPYRGSFSKGPDRYMLHSDPQYHIAKPMGYSMFPHEIYPTPAPYVATTGNLVWTRTHDAGGHFAAMEKPEALAADIEDFLAQVWKT